MPRKDDAKVVFEAWQEYQVNPFRCRLTTRRRKLINARLKEHPPEELVALVQWAYESDDAAARWLRGENDRRQAYLDLENLFRVSKTAPRAERAMEWLDE
jgi:hypothetical protein